MPQKTVPSFIRRHSLGVASVSILVLWIVLYSVSDPGAHVGSFFGNAIAEWAGVVVTVLATKYMYEKGSGESRQPADKGLNPVRKLLRDHSLTMFLVITGGGWVVLY